MPWLAGLVCCSAFDIALHDAYGTLHQIPVYETYNKKFMNLDLSHFLEDAEGHPERFSGEYPSDFFSNVNDILDRLLHEYPRIYEMILYVEQPFPYDLEKNRIDVHSVSARKPLFRDGSVGKLSASLDGLYFPYQFNIDLLGTEGAIRDNRIYSKSLFPEQTDFVTIPCITPNSGAVSHHPFQQEIDNLTENILYGTPVLSDVLDACHSQEIALAIEESASTGKPVKVTGA